MEFAPYDSERDWDDCLRIWEEVGWIDAPEGRGATRCKPLFDAGRARVARIDGHAECLVLAAPGSMRYLDEDLPYSGVTGVTTGRVARRQGLATRLTAQVIAEETETGAAVSGLGVFEQGFYDRLGYGTGTYDHLARFDPQSLTVDFPKRPAKRLTTDDATAMHANRLGRARTHGGVSLTPRASPRGKYTKRSAASAWGTLTARTARCRIICGST